MAILSDTSTPPPAPIDWAALVAELDALAEASLGKRAQKIKNVLEAADQSGAGIEAAIDQITSMTLVFVDPVRLADLADDMRTHLACRIGKPLPERQSATPEPVAGYEDPGVLAAIADQGCLGHTLLCLGLVVAVVCVVVSILTA